MGEIDKRVRVQEGGRAGLLDSISVRTGGQAREEQMSDALIHGRHEAVVQVLPKPPQRPVGRICLHDPSERAAPVTLAELPARDRVGLRETG